MCISISKISRQNVQQCGHFLDQNVNLFSKALSESNITPVLCDTDPNSSYPKLQKLYMNKFENFFPLIKISYKKTNNQWFHLDLHTLLNSIDLHTHIKLILASHHSNQVSVGQFFVGALWQPTLLGLQNPMGRIKCLHYIKQSVC